jgi:hypothetical protein
MKARIWYVVILLCVLALAWSGPGTAQVGSAQSRPAAPAPGSSPVMFIENVGQFAGGARFRVYGGARTLWLAEGALGVKGAGGALSFQPPSLNLREGACFSPR